MNKLGHFEKGRWLPAGKVQNPDVIKNVMDNGEITINLNVEGLENIQKVKEALIELDMVKRGVMTLDDTFTQQGFDDVPVKEKKVGIVNRVKNAGRLVWRAAVCPFQSKK